MNFPIQAELGKQYSDVRARSLLGSSDVTENQMRCSGCGLINAGEPICPLLAGTGILYNPIYVRVVGMELVIGFIDWLMAWFSAVVPGGD